MLTKNPNVSVVVCTRNRGNSAVNTIESILADKSSNIELILVDQSTNLETKDSVLAFCTDPRFRYIPSNTIGVARARNIGLQEARGGCVIFTDDDCRVPANWIETMAGVFASHPKVAVAFSNVISSEFDEKAGFIPTYIRKGSILVDTLWGKTRARGIGASMAVRKGPITKINGFDESLGPGAKFSACEEGDLAVRAILSGWAVYETVDTYVMHDGFRTWQEGKALAKRNWVGIGAAYAKPLRCGRLMIIPVIFYEAFIKGLLEPLSNILKFKKITGLKSFYYFWQGFYEGWKTQLDYQAIKYIVK